MAFLIQTELSADVMEKGMVLEGRRYIAFSPALDISTSGKTEKEAKKRFEEMVQIFLEEMSV
jgi:hypothetical protein